MQFFHDLGSLVERGWRDQNYDEAVFPDIAERALEEMPPCQKIDPREVLSWLQTASNLPAQRDLHANFSDLPITVYRGPRFCIDLYFWLDGTTSLHQHGFCGAFHVFRGSSILGQYRFKHRQEINAHFCIGETVLDSIELLQEGDNRRILPGADHIHSLFHLDRPSVTVTIRTYQTPNALPQYKYLKPYFAIDPFYEEETSIKKVQSVSLLLGMRHPDTDSYMSDLVSSSDFQTTFAVLDIAFNNLTNIALEKVFNLQTGKDRFQNLLEIARLRHGHLVDLIPPVLEEARRQTEIINRRSGITGTDHRFFLALLLNVPHREMIFDLVRQRFPDRAPIETITDWVEELAHTRVTGSSEPNVLGIEDFDEDYLFVFQCLLEGQTDNQIRAAFERELPTDEFKALGNKPEHLCNAIRNSMLFRSIFSEPQSAAVSVQQATL